ncbi:MAG: CbtB-domain containing protein [Streptosporangiaceae bacterium]
MTTSTLPTSGATPLVVPRVRAAAWTYGTVLFAVVLYYFLGVDQGATSVFGDNVYIHEFLHDGRHLLGFPCH